MKAKLKRPYIEVKMDDGRASYGGSQKWFEDKKMNAFGCGAIAAHDVTEYLSGAFEASYEDEKDRILREKVYKQLLEDYKNRYVPLIPRFGTVGWFLAYGMNKGFKECNLPYRAFWGVRPKYLFRQMKKMLKADIPVILSVGPDTPNRSDHYMLALYSKNPDGTYANTNACRAHFLVVTAMNEEWLQVSSWGRCYYINIQEYKDYVHYHSNWLGSNIMMIRKVR